MPVTSRHVIVFSDRSIRKTGEAKRRLRMVAPERGLAALRSGRQPQPGRRSSLP
jgi:hypothetical protein